MASLLPRATLSFFLDFLVEFAHSKRRTTTALTTTTTTTTAAAHIQRISFVFFVTFPDNALLVFLKIGLHERRNFVKVRIVADVVNVLALVNEMQSTWLEVFDTHLMKLFHRW